MKPKKRLELSNRDFKILQYIFEQRAVSHFQIGKKFFENCHRSVAHERMSKLAKFGLLKKSVTYTDYGSLLYYSPTEKGLQYILKNEFYNMTDINFKSDSINHDIGLVNIRERLLQSKMILEYLSECTLQNTSSLKESEDFRPFIEINSDATLVINGKNGKYFVALEYEISDKAESRYKKKILHYYMSFKIGVVLYVCKNPKIENLIRKVDSEIGAKYGEKIFTCLEKNCLDSNSELVFSNWTNATYRLA